MTAMPWSRVTSGRRNGRRSASSSPPCGPGRRDDRAQEDGEGGGGHLEPAEGRAGRAPTAGRVGPAGRPARWWSTTALAMQDHRQQEVGHHEAGLQLEQHGEPAQHDLADHAGHQPDRQPQQVLPAGTPDQRAEHGQHHRHRHQPGDRAVHELDHGVVLPRRHDPVLGAGRPVRAAQPRAGQAHRAAGDDDEGQGQQGEEGDPAVGRRGEGRHAHVGRRW